MTKNSNNSSNPTWINKIDRKKPRIFKLKLRISSILNIRPSLTNPQARMRCTITTSHRYRTIEALLNKK